MLEKKLQMTTETKNNLFFFFADFPQFPQSNSHLKSSKPQKYKRKHKYNEIENERVIEVERKHSSNDAIVVKKCVISGNFIGSLQHNLHNGLMSI